MIRFEKVQKSFKEFVAIEELSLHFRKGELAVLIGPSGCGKTTSLRMINRLISPTKGSIYINGKDSASMDLVDLRRSIGYVIQQIALFPHMTIAQNIGLVPLLKKWPEQKRKEHVVELLDLVGMPAAEYYSRYPHELSGGQQQRIGVARALAADPEIILMDEPFGAVDPITRDALQDELMRLQDEVQKTIIFVTHDIDEALKLADRIAVMKDGKVLQFDTPEQLLQNPADEFVEEFIGRDRLLRRPELISVTSIMIREPVTIRPDRQLPMALDSMRQHRVDSLLVTNRSGELLGILTAQQAHLQIGKAERVDEVMSTPLHYVYEDASVSTVLSLMANEQIGYVPVLSEKKTLLGLVTRSSLVNVLGQHV